MATNDENIPLVESKTTEDDQIPVLQSPSIGKYTQVTTPTIMDDTVVSTAQVVESQPTREEAAEDLMHGINSFWAIVTPVAITMLIASFVVVHYRSTAIQQSMSSYLVFDEDGEASGSTLLGESLINALVIIGFVAVLTFVMVLLYKYNCMKFLIGYIMFASTAILGFEGGQLIDTIVVQSFEWPVDWPSFLYVMYNFAVVGVISVFYQKGTSKVVQNGYLVMISVILAWQFSMWPEWTTWIFCSMFAVYDLCAVLTPCGPLKCLIGLIQEKQQPMPGLLYEADVRDGVGPRSPAEKQRVPKPAQPSAEDITDQDEDQIAQDDFTVESHPEKCETLDEFKAQLKAFYQKASPSDEWKTDHVAQKFFDKQDRMWPLMFHKYMVCTCRLGQACPVQIDAHRRAQLRQEEEEDKTIKLGLGDFIFYSVLVGRAALFDFSTLAQCFLCIVMGLGGTLFLLSVLHKALPALPFSIFLATIFYFWTRYTFVDYVDFLNGLPAAV